MKRINYKFCFDVSYGTEKEPNIKKEFLNKSLPYSDEALETAKQEAYNGEYTIVDDGQPEPVAEPTTDEILNTMLGVTV